MYNYPFNIKKTLLLALSILLMVSQASAQQWRLVATVHQDYDITIAGYVTDDSVRYDYSNDRGSSYNNDTVNYDRLRQYKYGLSGSCLYRETKNLYNLDNTINTSATYGNANVNGNNQWVVQSTDTMTYANGLLQRKQFHKRTYTLGQFVLLEVDDYSYSYNSKGLLTSTINNSDIVGNRNRNYYLYDTADRLILDSSKIPHPTVPTLYLLGKQKVYTYDTAGRLTTLTTYYIDTPQNNVTDIHYFFYNSKGELAMDSIANSPHIHTYTYTANGRLATDSLYWYDWNTKRLLYTEVISYTYTSYDRIDEIQKLRYDTLGVIRVGEKTKYYYSPYWPTATANVQVSNQDLTLYPVPTANMLNIRWDAKQPTQVQGRIVNNVGQTVQQWSDEVDGVYTKQILTHNLPNGMYYVILQADGVEMKKTLIITH